MPAAGNEPDFRTISYFGKIHRKALKGFLEQVLKIVLETGAMKLGGVAWDGTKLQANAGKHQAIR
jgi:transposase